MPASRPSAFLKEFEKLHWMPPELTDLNEGNWATSEFGRALAVLRALAATGGTARG